MNRPLYTWLVLFLCLALVLGALAFVSLEVLRLDAEGAKARREAALEENIRLALWRMDSAVAPLLGQENARPSYVYRSFFPAESAYNPGAPPAVPGSVLVPSPLLGEIPAHVLVHFQFDSAGRLSSPQVPSADEQELARRAFSGPAGSREARARLKEIEAAVAYGDIYRALRGRSPPEPDSEQLAQADFNDVQVRQNAPAQQALNTIEWRARTKATRQQAAVYQNFDNNAGRAPEVMASELMHPLWFGDRLVLARRVQIGGGEFLQGCWLDWPALRQELLQSIGELLPQARLEPQPPGERGKEARSLAALPVRLVPGELPSVAEPLSPVQLTLLFAAGFALLAILAVAWLVQGTLSLSERRGAFVSAVTHELRTPLTTFRLYTEMLASGMVTEDDKRQHYLQTLQGEAERLDHLVQNVLSYARLEKTRKGAAAEVLSWGALLGRFQERFGERCLMAGMILEVQSDPEALGAPVRVDPAALERILFNLVDNACKYAGKASDRRVQLGAERQRGRLLVRVHDHGPGIGREEGRRLFRPFSKSAKQAAESAPGVGLGLALSRRLARRMGGDLLLDLAVADGACFVLILPLVI